MKNSINYKIRIYKQRYLHVTFFSKDTYAIIHILIVGSSFLSSLKTSVLHVKRQALKKDNQTQVSLFVPCEPRKTLNFQFYHFLALFSYDNFPDSCNRKGKIRPKLDEKCQQSRKQFVRYYSSLRLEKCQFCLTFLGQNFQSGSQKLNHPVR